MDVSFTSGLGTIFIGNSKYSTRKSAAEDSKLHIKIISFTISSTL
jgi:hypothetical protein